MIDLQRELLGWAATQPALTGAVLLAGGVLYAFHGFRLFAFLLGLSCAGLGFFVGAAAAAAADLPPNWLGLAGAAALGALSLRWKKPATAAVCAATWGVLGYYLATQLQLAARAAWLAGGIAALLGVLFACLCYRTITVILTALQGTVLMVIGFAAVSTQVIPAVGVTFRQWVNAQALLLPVFLAMVFAAAYSYQTMHQQGDIRTGK